MKATIPIMKKSIHLTSIASLRVAQRLLYYSSLKLLNAVTAVSTACRFVYVFSGSWWCSTTVLQATAFVLATDQAINYSTYNRYHVCNVHQLPRYIECWFC